MIDHITNASWHYQNAQRGKNRDRSIPITATAPTRSAYMIAMLLGLIVGFPVMLAVVYWGFML